MLLLIVQLAHRGEHAGRGFGCPGRGGRIDDGDTSAGLSHSPGDAEANDAASHDGDVDRGGLGRALVHNFGSFPTPVRTGSGDVVMTTRSAGAQCTVEPSQPDHSKDEWVRAPADYVYRSSNDD